MNQSTENKPQTVAANMNQIPSRLDYIESEKVLLTEETTCGIWIFKGEFLQKLANKNVYVFLYGMIGLVFSATYAYFNGTITTLEKRYHITSQTSGTISVGNDVSQLFASAILSYYAGKGHRPRWMAFGLGTIVIFCLMNIVPHFLYGPGEDALALTVEYGSKLNSDGAFEALEKEDRKTLCNSNDSLATHCEDGDGNYTPQVILFVAQFISGIGQPLYYTLGVSYMDDNIQKSKTPTFISLAYFIRMLGPALGYTLASLCLKLYISPSLTPTIDNLDPRWLGAWWLGWFIFAILMFIFALLLAMFPKTLPRAAVRRVIQNEKNRQLSVPETEITKASLGDMFKTFKRLLKNTTFMLNNIASFFYIFGYIPYWTFTPKYIETQYRQSASVSSLVTGAVALVFSAIGILLSGCIISKYRPSARVMAAWNVIVGFLSVLGVISYIFLGCAENEWASVSNYSHRADLATCDSKCFCDHVKYSPICGENGRTYISGCHGGCENRVTVNGSKIYTNCSCVERVSDGETLGLVADNISESIMTRTKYDTVPNDNFILGGSAVQGSCPVDCKTEFYTFLAVMCVLKFFGASSRSTNFLVGVRCVDENDKTVAMGFGLMLMGFAFIPSPIFFGMILDSACLVWGKTCSGTGNCWLYDGEILRYTLNIIAAVLIAIGVLFDVGVWYFVKDLKIFDDEEQKIPNSMPIIEQNLHLNSMESTEDQSSVLQRH